MQEPADAARIEGKYRLHHKYFLKKCVKIMPGPNKELSKKLDDAFAPSKELNGRLQRLFRAVRDVS